MEASALIKVIDDFLKYPHLKYPGGYLETGKQPDTSIDW